MGYNPNISHLYVGYSPFANHLLTAWDIQALVYRGPIFLTGFACGSSAGHGCTKERLLGTEIHLHRGVATWGQDHDDPKNPGVP